MLLQQSYFSQFLFFFQAEDGIRDLTVTGVQTCALPIWRCSTKSFSAGSSRQKRSKASWRNRRCETRVSPLVVRTETAMAADLMLLVLAVTEIGRASCRERV